MSFPFLLLDWLAGSWLFWRLPRLRRAPRANGQALVSVVVPARNEERRLPALLASLEEQTLKPVEIVVVDDASADGTSEVANSYGTKVIQLTELPDGWTGKSWACWQGACAASGECLLFLDADTWLTPDGVAALVREQRPSGGLVSVLPYHEVHRPHEQFSALFAILLTMGSGAAQMPFLRTKPTGAFGPCLICRRDDYFAVGGHSLNSPVILEDIALADAFERNGLTVQRLAGKGIVSFRMYPDGPASLIEGWSKNFASGAGCTPLVRLLASVLWVSGGFDAFRLLLRSLFSKRGRLKGAAAYLAYAGQIHFMLRQLGSFSRVVALCYPLYLVFYVGVFLYSLMLTRVKGSVRWRGRSIDLTGSARRRG